MKAKIVIFVVVLLVFATAGIVLAEAYSESSCDNRILIEIPGPLGEPASSTSTDQTVLNTALGSYTLVGRAYIIGHGNFTLDGVPVSNTYTCYYTGGYYPPQSRVDEITAGLAPDECIFVEESGTIRVNTPVNGSCILPAIPTPTSTPTTVPTKTATPTATATPTTVPTATPTATLEPSPTATEAPIRLVLEGGINKPDYGGWVPMVNGSSANIVTKFNYDTAPAAYSEPGTTIKLAVWIDKESDPEILNGTGTFVWNTAGYWDFTIVATNGLAEIKLVSSPVGLPGKYVRVEAWIGNQTHQTWQATVSKGVYEVFLPLILR